jgi:hypothetical protein
MGYAPFKGSQSPRLANPGVKVDRLWHRALAAFDRSDPESCLAEK